MVDVTSTAHQHRRRRKKNNARYPSPALLASLAAFIPHSVLARPVLLPFLYPSIPQSTSTSPPQHQQPHRPKPKRSATASSSSTSTPSSSRQPAANASQAESEQRRADRIAYHYKADDDGSYKPTCWSLHGQSNCPRDDAVDDGSIAEPDMHEVVPGEQPDFPPTSTSTSPSTPTTTSLTTTTTSAAPASTTTVEPYTMTFEVSNIPPGWQKSGRTSFYSKNIIIGFSVTLAALICLTIVLCVIWRIRVARERRESERALKEKKKELGLSSQTSDESSLYHDQDRESTRQRGLRRRRANVRADDEDEDGDENGDDHDDHDNGGAASHERHEPAAMSERNGTTSLAGRKRRTAFMRTFSGKMLTAPMKWKVNRRRRQQEQEPQQEDRMTEVGSDDNEDGEGDERPQPRRRDTTASRASVAPPQLETQNSSSRLLAQQPTTPAVETPIPASPPPPPPATLSTTSTTSPRQDQAAAEDDDDDDPTAIHPPAYRRRNFGIRPRARPTTAPMSPRALEKQREAEGAGVEAEDVPEEYMYLAGMMPPPVRSNTVTAATTPARNGAAVRPQRRISVVEQDRDDEDEEEDNEEDGTDGEDAVEARREDVTAHIATDDKAALARLHQSSSAPSAPPALDSEDEDEQELRPVVPAEDEIYGLEGSGSSSHLPPPPSPPPPATLLPAPPAITSAHLFVPPPPHEPSDLPQYVAGPSAPSFLGPEKLSVLPSAPEDLAVSGPSEPPVLPSAPPAENDSAATAGFVVVPSAPPIFEDDEVTPSAPPLEDDGHAGPSAPSRAA